MKELISQEIKRCSYHDLEKACSQLLSSTVKYFCCNSLAARSAYTNMTFACLYAGVIEGVPITVTAQHNPS